MWTAMDSLPWLAVLGLGLLGGWFGRTGVWWLQDAARDAHRAAERGFTEFGRFIGRVLLGALLLGALVVVLYAVTHAAGK